MEGYVKGGKDLNSWSMWVALETYLQVRDEEMKKHTLKIIIYTQLMLLISFIFIS